MMASEPAEQQGGHAVNLYRVTIRSHEYLGTAEEHHAKVVATDPFAALCVMVEALELEAAGLAGVSVTLICRDCKEAEGEVLELGHRCRGFGERGGWLADPPRKRKP